jgi:hypothetical protein
MNVQDPESGLFIIEREEDIPAFASEDEEREFWDTHTFSDGLLETFGPPDEEVAELLGLRPLHLIVGPPLAVWLDEQAVAAETSAEAIAARILEQAMTSGRSGTAA